MLQYPGCYKISVEHKETCIRPGETSAGTPSIPGQLDVVRFQRAFIVKLLLKFRPVERETHQPPFATFPHGIDPFDMCRRIAPALRRLALCESHRAGPFPVRFEDFRLTYVPALGRPPREEDRLSVRAEQRTRVIAKPREDGSFAEAVTSVDAFQKLLITCRVHVGIFRIMALIPDDPCVRPAGQNFYLPGNFWGGILPVAENGKNANESAGDSDLPQVMPGV